MNQRKFFKQGLLNALQKAGLPYTMPNFVYKYEQTVCDLEGCPNFGEPYLTSPRTKGKYRVYRLTQIRQIVSAAKKGWFNKHWHWKP